MNIAKTGKISNSYQQSAATIAVVSDSKRKQIPLEISGPITKDIPLIVQTSSLPPGLLNLVWKIPHVKEGKRTKEQEYTRTAHSSSPPSVGCDL